MGNEAKLDAIALRPGGELFADLMPWQNASKMTADDLAALYAYLTVPVK